MEKLWALFIQTFLLLQMGNALAFPEPSSLVKNSIIESNTASADKDHILRTRNFYLQRSEAAKAQSHEKISPDVFKLSPATQEYFDRQRQKYGSSEPKYVSAFERGLLKRRSSRKGKEVLSCESAEIKDAVAFAEFKMQEVNALMQECIEQKFTPSALISTLEVKNECVGLSFQILFYNYKEGIHRIKEIFLELLRIKLEKIKEEFEEETAFFLDILDELIDKDYNLVKSFDICRKATKYYVSPRYFDKLMIIAKPEIDALTEIHVRLKQSRKKIQELFNRKEQEAVVLEEKIEDEAEKFEQAQAEKEKESEEEENQEEVEEPAEEEEAQEEYEEPEEESVKTYPIDKDENYFPERRMRVLRRNKTSRFYPRKLLSVDEEESLRGNKANYDKAKFEPLKSDFRQKIKFERF